MCRYYYSKYTRLTGYSNDRYIIIKFTSFAGIEVFVLKQSQPKDRPTWMPRVARWCLSGASKLLLAYSRVLGRPSFLQDTTLHSHNSTHTTQHGTSLYGHNSIPHNFKRPQLDTAQLNTPQLDTPQFDTPQPYTTTTLHRSHGRTVEATIQGRPSFLQVTTLHRHNSTHTTLHGPFLHTHNSMRHNSTPP